MDVRIQLIALTFSFFYGSIFYLLNKLNNNIIKGQKKIYQSLITILFMYNIILLYIISMYKINNGQFHIYFIFMIVLGFISSYKLTKKLENSVKFSSFVEKIKRACYTKDNKGWSKRKGK